MKYYKDCAIVKESVEEEDVVGEDAFEKGERRNRKKKKTVQHRVHHKGKTNLFSKKVTWVVEHSMVLDADWFVATLFPI